MSQYVSNIDSVIDIPIMEKFSQASNIISRETQWRIFLACLVLCDLALTALAYRVAYWVRFEQFAQFFQEDARTDINYYRLLAAGLVASWLVLNALFGL